MNSLLSTTKDFLVSQIINITTHKSLACEIVFLRTLLWVHSSMAQVVKASIAGHDVKSIHLLVLRIVNDGNLPIVQSDFEEPLVIDLGQSALILSGEVIDTTPIELKPDVMFDTNKIVIHPLTLHSQHALVLKLYITGYEGIKFLTRLAGIPKPRKISDATTSIDYEFFNQLWHGALATLITAIVLLLLTNWLLPNWTPVFFVATLFIMMSGITLRAANRRKTRLEEISSYRQL